VQREVLASVSDEKRERANAPAREHQSQQAAQGREQDRFGEELPHHAQAARAQTEAQRHFAAAPRRARQQQVGDVGAGNRQEQADHRHQHVKRLGILTPQEVEPARAFLQEESRQVRPLLVGRGGGLDEIPEDGSDGGLALLHGHAGLQPPHHFDPVAIGIARFDGFVRQVRPHGQVDILRPGGIDAKELRRRDAGHDERRVVDQDGLPDRSRHVTETALSVSETEDDDRWRTGAVVCRIDQPAGGWRDPEAAEVLARYVLAIGEVGLPLNEHIEAPGSVEGKEGREHRTVLA